MLRIGIDLGGTNIEVGIVDENYNIISHASRKTAMPRGADAIADDMAAAVLEALRKADLTAADISSAGIGAPGSIDGKSGIVRFSPNLNFNNLPLSDMLNKRTGIKFALANDANAAALGEFLAGSGKDARDFIMVTLGTGIGGGIVVDGKIIEGINGAGGEIGHIVISMGGEKCGCGRRGCFEAYGSVTALIRQTKCAIENNPDSIMAKAEKIDGRTAFDAAKNGDAAALEVVDNYTTYLAVGLGNLINIFQPEVIAIGGGISKEGDYLLAPIKEKLKNESFCKNLSAVPKICTAELFGDAGIIGAAFLE